MNLSSHRASCDCGLSVTQRHAVLGPGLIGRIAQDPDVADSLRATCVLCGGPALGLLGGSDDVYCIETAEELASIAPGLGVEL